MRVDALEGIWIRYFSHFKFIYYVLLLVVTSQVVAQRLEIQHDGRSYIDLATAGGQLGMKAYWLKGQQTFRLRSQWTNIDVGRGKRILYLNRLPIYLGFPTLVSNGRLYLSNADYMHVLQPILTPQAFSAKPRLRRIVIDAGHGGRDVGAKNDAYRLYEKDLTLDVARRLQSLLLRAGYEVIMTRDSDVYIPLERRPQIANRANGDLFISIHFNAAASSTAEGVETFVLTPQYQASSKYTQPGRGDHVSYAGNQQDAWNTLFGYHLQRALVQGVGGPDRGLKRARFLVLKHLDCPGVLVELGFVSHSGSANKLRTTVFRTTLAQSLYDGIIRYGQRLQRIP
ncbi:N-acetylmuramoyl-L-alanine amidase [Coraliomargarita sp. SDUM461004]|uniref:N-acetylmuramoyl-L-alanine amidase n=1 Tax=Thalassobacterium sedimentorum TaxID=3041258 RepID=A0ABU1AK37_9BACT|nr:N-acetylmuramoyl-L-alanine amidase [Coraliomargarita sp. SDUM461004]MDQ8194538.1 N-acetylmuramoyl-L-alanine amidase [Coraliomargarita sp. SDUM461004]